MKGLLFGFEFLHFGFEFLHFGFHKFEFDWIQTIPKIALVAATPFNQPSIDVVTDALTHASAIYSGKLKNELLFIFSRAPTFTK
jgi:hypothetical protein